jgi:glycosyltransferase involved in cell wall biosynthesis
MKILFVHQNYPGQYLHLAKALALDPRHQVVAIGEWKERPDYGYPVLTYAPPLGPSRQTHHYVRDHEGHVRRGQQVFRLCQELRKRGFVPDVICAHPGWGEALFLKDVFPAARLLAYCEFFYRARGSDMDFDPEFPSNLDSLLKVRIKNATQLLSLTACDAGISPTAWQHSQYPSEYRSRIRIQHEGVDTNLVRPNPEARLSLGEGKPVLGVEDEVVTFVARNLEPYRGFHSFARAIPAIQRARPNARIVIIGGNDVSYGRCLPDGQTYAERYLSEISFDPVRVHFLGRVSYQTYLAALRVSSVHVYLTYPFVLSWSCLEAMAAGCVLVGSRTAPVQEFIADGETGLLVDFFSAQDIAARVVDVLANQADFEHMRHKARNYIRQECDLHSVAIPAQTRIVESLLDALPV